MRFTTPANASAPGELAVITCIFTPQPHERRRRNFEEFRKQFGQNLYVAELSYYERPAVTREGSNVFHFRGGERHVLWQKERLLNELLQRLPDHVTAVAWVDADVLFVDPQWTSRALKRLDQFPVIQLFETVIYLNANGFPDTQRDGIIASAARNGSIAYDERKGAAGFAWAARRDVLERVQLMDFMVLGGADTYMACGFSGMRPASIFSQLPGETRRAVEAWGEQAYKLTGGETGYLPGTIEHLFHGSLKTRGYLQRYEMLRKAAFDPAEDLVVDECGLYTWRKPNERIQEEVAAYFARRSVAENT